MKIKEIRLILGDQLNINHSWFTAIDPSVLYVLMEVKSESEYVTHHIQKVVAIFSAMREFASLLKDKGHQLRYFKINDSDNHQDFIKNLTVLQQEFNPQKYTTNFRTNTGWMPISSSPIFPFHP